MIYEDVCLGYVKRDNHSFRINRGVHITSIHLTFSLYKMPRTKQTARKVEQEKPPQGKFPKKDKTKKKDKKKEKESEPPGAGVVPSTSARGNENVITLRQTNLDLGDSQTLPDPETLMPSQTMAQLEE